MKMKKYISVMLLAAMATGAAAQQSTTPQNQKELNKEITLEKDFVPEVKKAVKKNTLPAVKKVTPPAKTTVNYSDWANPIDVPSSIPTMMPYGYRTAHNFSHKRGYLVVGGGMAANFAGSAGYRIVDEQNTTLGAWLQHNSTWAGKNSSLLVPDGEKRLKQKFNDNVVGLDLMHRMKYGTITMSARGHFDSFNYYGGIDPLWDDAHKQTFMEFGLKGGWDAEAMLSNDRTMDYNVGLAFNHAGYDEPVLEDVKAAKENTFNLTAGAEYGINDNVGVGLQMDADYVNTSLTDGSRNYFLLTLQPYFTWENSILSAHVGADLLLGKPQLFDFSGKHADGFATGKFHVSPNVQLNFNFAPGAAFYVDVTGGKTLNTLSSLAAQNRYSAPMAFNYNTFSPFDGEAGFKIGPFAGFSMKVYGGYGIFKGDLNALLIPSVMGQAESGVATILPYTPFTFYIPLKARGMKIGAELNYKYRSLVEATAGIVYAPADDEVNYGGWTRGYPLDGFDGASLVSNIDLKFTPIRQLAFNVGLNVRSGRSQVEQRYIVDEAGEQILDVVNEWYDMSDVINLHAGASWRFDKVVTLWVKGDNLLNRKWDVLPGMGAQKFNVMGGVSLVF
ncbi:MAG: hypothetical protein IJ775_05515 [Muribaculaceae bacterium]|nr:hypothetical protein [Muribaculaceae bacterium]